MKVFYILKKAVYTCINMVLYPFVMYVLFLAGKSLPNIGSWQIGVILAVMFLLGSFCFGLCQMANDRVPEKKKALMKERMKQVTR